MKLTLGKEIDCFKLGCTPNFTPLKVSQNTVPSSRNYCAHFYASGTAASPVWLPACKALASKGLCTLYPPSKIMNCSTGLETGCKPVLLILEVRSRITKLSCKYPTRNEKFISCVTDIRLTEVFYASCSSFFMSLLAL